VKKLYGIIMIAIGLMLIFSAQYLSVQLKYDPTPPEIFLTDPSGTLEKPTVAEGGKNYWLSAIVVEDQTEITDVWCEVYRKMTDGSWQLYQNVTGFLYDDETGWWEKSFLTPSGTDLLVKCVFKAKNEANKVGEKTAYMLINPTMVPDGNFFINGDIVKDGDEIAVGDPSIVFKFIATKFGNRIVDVIVKITKDDKSEEFSLIETLENDTWEKNYELKWGAGIYLVSVMLDFTPVEEPSPSPNPSPEPGEPPGVESVTLLSITINILGGEGGNNNGGNLFPFKLNFYTVIGLALVFAGLYVYFVGGKSKGVW